MAEVMRIIEWQEDKQRTPQEVVQYLQDNIESISHILVIYTNDLKEEQFYVPGAAKRDYTKSMVLWDIEHFKRNWLEVD